MKNIFASICFLSVAIASPAFGQSPWYEGGYRVANDGSNDLEILHNNAGEELVSITVFLGPADERDFMGVVTKVDGNVLTAKEASIGDYNVVNGFIKGGCTLQMKITDNVVAVLLGKTCNSDLGRINGALKQ